MERAIDGRGSHIRQMLPIDQPKPASARQKKELIDVSRFVHYRSLAIHLDCFRRPGTIASAIPRRISLCVEPYQILAEPVFQFC